MTLRAVESAQREPYDARAEHDLLWFAVTDVGRRKLLLQGARREDFFVREHAAIFTAIQQLDSEGEGAIDIEMVAARLSEPSAKEIARRPAANTWYIDETFERHLTRLRQLSTCRLVTTTLLQVAGMGLDPSTVANPEEYLDQAARTVTKALEVREAKAMSSTLPQLAEDFARELIDPRSHLPKSLSKMPFRGFDKTLSHLEAGRFYVIAGRPGMGKSALSMQIAYMLAERDRKRVLVYSLEMSREEITNRLIAAMSGIPLERVTRREFFSGEERRLLGAAEKLAKVDGFEVIDAASMKFEDIIAHARAEHARSPLLMILIDYLQLAKLRHRTDQREENVAIMTGALKLIARVLSIIVVVAAQLNRENEKRQNKRPQMSDLRESGAIEQDTDAILLIHRDGMYSDSVDKSATEVIVAKNRSGPPGTVKLTFAGELTWFADEASHGL